MRLIKQIKDSAALRDSFDRLAVKTFGLSFADWRREGYWTDDYIPYVMADGETVAANASVNRMNFVWRGQRRRYIQIGTVMTDEAYRRQGLSRILLEEILKDWAGESDAVYLFANRTVLDFYPRFGFRREREYQYSSVVQGGRVNTRRLNMEKPADREILLNRFRLSNPYSQLSFQNNVGLLMFYCGGFLKENVYYIPDYDAVLIAEKRDGALLCYDVFCDGTAALSDIIQTAAAPDVTKAVWGFTPKETADCEAVSLDGGDDALFLYAAAENLFAEHRLMFPLLSHA